MGEKKNLKELNKILNDDEETEKTIVAWHDHREGVLSITNRRLLFVGKGLLSGLTVKDFPLEKIINVDYQLKSFTSISRSSFIRIYGHGNAIEFDGVIGSKDEVKDFVEHLKSKVGKQNHTASKDNDFISQLERLAKLKEQGILTEEEFQTQKEKILNES